MRELELLAPAANKEVARQAILHGADAVYIGSTSHGARKNASNSIEDIRETVEFAHKYRAKVYVTVNTLVYDRELESVRDLIAGLYRTGVDAIIVQDMSILRMDIPPIQLHASTQCDTETPEKAEFLEKAGFSQIVLARELSLDEIKRICDKVTVPVECFVHGALCVCYSGRCQASQSCLGRSANRGECAQMCRLPYTLRNADGEIILKDRYLLSLSDFNASNKIGEMIEAGVSSFKIEGRLKDAAYVKNVVAAYRRILDDYIACHPEYYRRSSFGESTVSFEPVLEKSFNRGFTEYFLEGRKKGSMASLLTPKSLGEPIADFSELHNGDGISFLNAVTGEYQGARINKVENGRVFLAKGAKIPKNVELRRTYDIEWQKLMEQNTAERRVNVDISIDESGVSASDERGCYVRIPLDVEKFEAQKPINPRPIFEKLGTTVYKLRNFANHLNSDTFIPASSLTAIRRKLVEALDSANTETYPFKYRAAEDRNFKYPTAKLDSRDNISNQPAENFYVEHGVKQIIHAMEISHAGEKDKNPVVMTTRYCLRRELGCCKKDYSKATAVASRLKEPLTISSGPNRFRIEFDCSRCEMNLRHLKKR